MEANWPSGRPSVHSTAINPLSKWVWIVAHALHGTMSTRTQATDCNTRESSFSNSSRLTLTKGYALDAHVPVQPCRLGRLDWSVVISLALTNLTGLGGRCACDAPSRCRWFLSLAVTLTVSSSLITKFKMTDTGVGGRRGLGEGETSPRPPQKCLFPLGWHVMSRRW